MSNLARSKTCPDFLDPVRNNLSHSMMSAYRSVLDHEPSSHLPLTEALEHIRTGTYQAPVNAVRMLLATQGSTAYKMAKKRLPLWSFTGTFTYADKAGLQHHSGVCHGDLDGLVDPVQSQDRLTQDPHVAYVFLSPSAHGLKVGVHIPRVTSDDDYKRYWAAIAQDHADRYHLTWDASGKDISRLSFVSYDPNLYWNPHAQCVEEIAPSPQPKDTPVFYGGRWEGRKGAYLERAVTNARRLLTEAAPGTRHRARLRAGCLLGGYVAGGFLRLDEAFDALENALLSNTQTPDQARQDLQRALRYGMTHPVTLADLEAKRQQWLQRHGTGVRHG